MTRKKLTYAGSGVDFGQEESTIKALTSKFVYRKDGLGSAMMDVGHYAGLIDFGDYALAMTTDGVGSKVLIANEMKKWDTVGIDCIAMNVNDLLAIGAEPLAFVDYLAVEAHDDNFAKQIGEGLVKGANISRVSIVGGETATLPELIKGFDLAGACLGMVKKEDIITGDAIEIGDSIIGIPSSGVHSNGYTLVRKIMEESKHSYHDKFPYDTSKTIGEVLLEPTRIYMEVLNSIRDFDIHGLAHITGSGLLKLRRITELGFDISDPIEPCDIFKFLQKEGNIDDHEMYKTFNMGMGFVLITSPQFAEEVAASVDGKVVGHICEKGIMVNGFALE